MTVSIQVKGAIDVLKTLARMKESAQKAIDRAVLKAGYIGVEEVQASIEGTRAEPRSWLTGRFLGSIKPALIRDPKNPGVEIYSNVKYAPWLEYGRRTDSRTGNEVFLRTGPRRHFRNSKERIAPRVREAMRENVRIALLREGVKNIGGLF